jgi:uncharacterized protein
MNSNMSPLSTSEVHAPKALDIQHDTDPAKDHGPARHIPHIGHALLFFSIAWLMLSLCVVVVFAAAHIHTEEAAKAHPGLALLAQVVSYVLTLACAWWLFPKLWDRTFLQGIEWNTLALRRRWFLVLPAGIAMSALAQYALRFVAEPKNTPVDALMHSSRGAWLLAAFGVLLAPFAEEIAFRGFLLPALAIAYDWLALERTPAGLQKWQNSALHSRAALIFAAIFSSVPFALLHAGQLHDAWGVLGILYGVSLILSIVRIWTNSVSCSVLMHATYNFTVFAVVFVMTGGFRHMEKMLQ